MTMAIQSLALNTIKNVQGIYPTGVRPKAPLEQAPKVAAPKSQQLGLDDLAEAIKKAQDTEPDKELSYKEVLDLFKKGDLDPRVTGEINIKSGNDVYKIYVAEEDGEKVIVFEHKNLNVKPGHISGGGDRMVFTFEGYDAMVAAYKTK